MLARSLTENACLRAHIECAYVEIDIPRRGGSYIRPRQVWLIR